MTDLRGHIAEAVNQRGLSFAFLERVADEVGVPKGGRATEHQLALILARVIQPASIEPEAAVARAAASADTPDPESATASAVSGSATAPEEPPPPPGSAPTIEDVLAVTGGELVEDKPKRGVTGRTIEEAIADAEAKAKKVPA